MMWLDRCVVLILLYHLQLTLAQVDLEKTGSCIEAELTECCLDKCLGLSGACFCDHTCLDAEDCCRDIYQLDFCGNFVGTECTSGSVRLVGGLRPYEGLVEVCIFQSWHPVCNASFSYPEALVACNQHGYTATLDSHTNTIQLLDNTTVLNRTAYGPNCSGNEPRLTECIVDFRYCVSGDEQATVQCIPIVNCSNPGQIKLVDGYHQFDGRVEICINGEWGTVCNDLWDYNDAKVVCRQLGHPEADAQAYNNSYFGEEVGQIKLHQVNCVGDESALLDCHYTIDSYDCYYYQAAGVECIDNSSRCSYYGELRLVGGESDNEGRVEICINGEWGTVCDDSWDNDDAKVVCKQLGYSANGALGQQGAHYGEGTGEIHFDEIGCSGNESNMLLCSHLPVGVHDCEHKEDAGVRCPHTISYMESASLPIAQIAGITVGAVVIVISLPTVFAILVMCYIRRKRLREKNTADLGNQDSTGPEKLDIQENSSYCHVVKHRPEPLYSNISEVVESPKVIDDENDYEIVL